MSQAQIDFRHRHDCNKFLRTDVTTKSTQADGETQWDVSQVHEEQKHMPHFAIIASSRFSQNGFPVTLGETGNFFLVSLACAYSVEP